MAARWAAPQGFPKILYGNMGTLLNSGTGLAEVSEQKCMGCQVRCVRPLTL